jgi:TatD DNase family protein
VHDHARDCAIARRQATAKCFLCGQRGHIRSECPNPKGNGNVPKHKARGDRGQRRKAGAQEESGEDGPATAAKALASIARQPFVDPCCRLHVCQSQAGLFGAASEYFDSVQLPTDCEGIVAIFADAVCFDLASPRYRCWEALLADERVWGAFGCEPADAPALADSLSDRLNEWIEGCPEGKVVAVVTGLDFRGVAIEDRQTQTAVFSALLRLAVKLDLPIMMSLGDAEQELLPLLSAAGVPLDWKIHLRSFAGDEDHLVLRLMPQLPNLFVGFDGRVTFAKSENLRRLLFDIPLGRLILETDAPGFIPTNLPGAAAVLTRSHPGVLPALAQRVAELQGLELSTLMEAVRENVRAVYGI